MTLSDTFQSIAAIGAVCIGLTYIIGGLIVNLNLTRRGVVEYQILKVKYLAVGIIFLFQVLGVLIFTLIPVVLLSTVIPGGAANELVVQLLSIPSILAALALLYVWSRYPSNTRSFVGTWQFWFILSVVATLFPLYVLLRQLIFPSASFGWVFNSLLAILSGGLTLMAQIYHYSSFYYGRPAGVGALDPIGMGIPTRVHLLCDEKYAPALGQLGLPIEGNIIRDVYLIDETDVHYIVAKEQVPGGDGTSETYKIDKGLVRVILHKPDHMRRLKG